MFVEARALDKAGIADLVLRESYRFCGRLLGATEGFEYWLASLLLPPHKRPHAWALYGFFRYADNLVDTGDPATRTELFDTWSARVLADCDAGQSGDPLIAAMVHTARTWGIATADVTTLLAGLRTDLTGTGFATYADLEHYLQAVDVSFGRMVLCLLEPTGDEADQRMAALAIAAQLTNIVRDVTEDAQAGRTYLPREELAALGLTRGDLTLGRPTHALRKLIQVQVVRARALWTEGKGVLDLVDPQCRAAFRHAVVLYEAHLDEIERRGYDVFSTRPRLGVSRKVVALLGADRIGDHPHGS